MFPVNADASRAPAASLPLHLYADDDANAPIHPCDIGRVAVNALACLAEVRSMGPTHIQISDVGRYCALLCGKQADKAGRPLAPVSHFLALDNVLPFIPGARLPVMRCVMLASLYIAVCQERAFLEDQSFDVAGLYRFVKACNGDTTEHIAQLLGDPNTPRCCFVDIVLTPLGNQFELRPANEPLLRLGMGKLVTANASHTARNAATEEAMNAPWLKNATLQDCHFEDISFGPVDLTGLRFQRCSLTGISMRGTQLRKTQWQNVTLTDCRFEACCVQLAQFLDCTFTDVYLTGCKLNLSRFFSTTMEEVAFVDCTFEGITLSGPERRRHSPLLTTMSKVTFVECAWRNNTIKQIRFHESSFGRMVRPQPVGKSHLEGCILLDCTIDVSNRLIDNILDCKFRRCKLVDANFTAVQFQNVDFHESTFDRAKFNFARWRGGSLTSCHGLAGANFSHAKLFNVVMEGAKNQAYIEAASEAATQTEPRAARALGNMNNIDFSFMSIQGGGFRNLQLSEASFESMHGTNVQWENCLLQASNFSNARFDNAVFSGCQLHQANFEGSVGPDWVSLMPNRFTASMGSWNALIAAEPVCFALSLESRAKLSDPIYRVRLLTQRATPDPILGLPQIAPDSEEDAATLLDNILALPSEALRQMAMIALINALNVQMTEGEWMDDVDVLLPLLCHTDYVGNPIIEAFLERRIAGLLSGAPPDAAVVGIDRG